MKTAKEIAEAMNGGTPLEVVIIGVPWENRADGQLEGQQSLFDV